MERQREIAARLGGSIKEALSQEELEHYSLVRTNTDYGSSIKNMRYLGYEVFEMPPFFLSTFWEILR